MFGFRFGIVLPAAYESMLASVATAAGAVDVEASAVDLLHLDEGAAHGDGRESRQVTEGGDGVGRGVQDGVSVEDGGSGSGVPDAGGDRGSEARYLAGMSTAVVTSSGGAGGVLSLEDGGPVLPEHMDEYTEALSSVLEPQLEELRQTAMVRGMQFRTVEARPAPDKTTV